MIRKILSGILTLTMTASMLSVAVLNAGASSDQHFNTGDIVLFGNYWQNDTNGDDLADQNDAKEPIEWRVLEQNGDDVFLMSEKLLDAQMYNTEWDKVTWETCSLRQWLNETFYNNAFNTTEKDAIKTTTVENNDNLHYSVSGGNTTYDKVYLPSIEEVTNRAYGFSDETNDNGTNWVGDPARCAKVTEYATSQSVSIRYDDTGWWWLRSPGCNGYGASYVYTYGSIADSGVPVNTTGRGLRPVLHINLQSINLTPQESDPASPTAMSTQSIDSTTTPTTSASVPTLTPFNSASPSGAASATATATAPAVTATPTTAPATATPTATSATATAPATRRPRHSKSPTSAPTNPTDKPSAIVTSSTSSTPTVSATSSVSASASSGMPSGNKTVLTAAFAKKTYKIKRKKSKKLTIMLMGNKKINTALLTGVFKANKKNRIKTGKVRKKIIANKSSIFCAIMTLKVKAKRKGKVILSGVVFNNKVSAKVKCKVVVR